MGRIHFNRQLNWRMVLVRIFVNALALLVITILPDIHFIEPTLLRVMFVAFVLGLLNAFVKPIIQFLTLRFIFITFGFAVVIINTLILLLLNRIVSGMFQVDSLIWAIIGGALMGLLVGFFENLLGLQVPIFPDDAGDLPTLDADPTKVFERKIIGGVIGQDEELAAEVPTVNEGDDRTVEEATAEVPPANEGDEPVTEELAAEVPPANEGDEPAAEVQSTQGGEGQ